MLEMFYPFAYVDGVFDINYQQLYTMGYRGLIFDIDNTLVHHGDNSNPRIDELFRNLHNIGFRTILLTDNDRERVERFIQSIDTPYICDAGKPNPDNFLKAAECLQLSRQQVIYIGDQIFMDILGANRAAIPNILVHFIRLDSEKWIGKRRFAEKLILCFYRLNKKYYQRLGDIQIHK